MRQLFRPRDARARLSHAVHWLHLTAGVTGQIKTCVSLTRMQGRGARTTAAGRVDGNAAVGVLLGGMFSGGTVVDRIVARGRFQRTDHLETALVDAADLSITGRASLPRRRMR